MPEDDRRRDTPDGWLPLSEVGEWLKIGRTTIYELMRKERLPAYRIGRTVRVRRHGVERWLKSKSANL